MCGAIIISLSAENNSNFKVYTGSIQMSIKGILILILPIVSTSNIISKAFYRRTYIKINKKLFINSKFMESNFMNLNLIYS